MDASLGLESGTVRLVPYDARWPVLFAHEAARIHSALATRGLPITLEHMGSTAVPGLTAKPIIDVLGGWRRDEDRIPMIAALQELGYVHRGEQDIAGREFFRLGDPRQYHLHLARFGGSFWRAHLAFRDLLRADAERADAYGTLKQKLALEHPRNREAYVDGKTTFVQSALHDATMIGLYGEAEP
jgi:GrpB-like predicted nucleotidyltransferase (UPF0157 family)